MKLSECSKGRLVRLAILTYDEVVNTLRGYGHIHGIDEDGRIVIARIINNAPTIVGRYEPEDLIPMED